MKEYYILTISASQYEATPFCPICGHLMGIGDLFEVKDTIALCPNCRTNLPQHTEWMLSNAERKVDYWEGLYAKDYVKENDGEFVIEGV